MPLRSVSLTPTKISECFVAQVVTKIQPFHFDTPESRIERRRRRQCQTQRSEERDEVVHFPNSVDGSCMWRTPNHPKRKLDMSLANVNAIDPRDSEPWKRLTLGGMITRDVSLGRSEIGETDGVRFFWCDWATLVAIFFKRC